MAAALDLRRAVEGIFLHHGDHEDTEARALCALAFLAMPRIPLRQAIGHWWTVAPLARHRLLPRSLPAWEPWTSTVDDPTFGAVPLTGAFHPPTRPSDTVAVVVHGVGGDVDSHYVQLAALAAVRAGMGCLRLNMRGADLSGVDLYHAGLTDDIDAAVRSLRGFDHVVLIGYSLGGHLALRYALTDRDPRLRALAAICAPLDLTRASQDIDGLGRLPYRRYVMESLTAMARALDAQGRLPAPLPQIVSIRRFRDWDDRVVAPRFGFADAEDYYTRTSVGRRLHRLALPSLFVGVPHDPMVLPRACRPSLRRASGALEVRWLDRGGHVGFPPGITLGLPGPRGLEPQVVRWLSERVDATAT